MQLTELNDEAQLNQLINDDQSQAVFKHNTSCSISRGVFSRLHAAEDVTGLKAIYLLDIQSQRPLSDLVASRSGVPHQSPQLLVFKNGNCIYHEWGFDISAEKIAEALDV